MHTSPPTSSLPIKCNINRNINDKTCFTCTTHSDVRCAELTRIHSGSNPSQCKMFERSEHFCGRLEMWPVIFLQQMLLLCADTHTPLSGSSPLSTFKPNECKAGFNNAGAHPLTADSLNVSKLPRPPRKQSFSKCTTLNLLTDNRLTVDADVELVVPALWGLYRVLQQENIHESKSLLNILCCSLFRVCTIPDAVIFFGGVHCEIGHYLLIVMSEF